MDSLLGRVPICLVAHITCVVLDNSELANLNGVSACHVVEKAELSHEIVGQCVLVVILSA